MTLSTQLINIWRPLTTVVEIPIAAGSSVEGDIVDVINAASDLVAANVHANDVTTLAQILSIANGTIGITNISWDAKVVGGTFDIGLAAGLKNLSRLITSLRLLFLLFLKAITMPC